jgi:hypothetical protein
MRYLLDVLLRRIATAVPDFPTVFARVAGGSAGGFSNTAKCRPAGLAGLRINRRRALLAARPNDSCDERLFDRRCDGALAEALCKVSPIDVTLIAAAKNFEFKIPCAKTLDV